MKMSTLIALCTALECTPNDLFDVDTTPVERPSAPPRPVQSLNCPRRPQAEAAQCRRSELAGIVGVKQSDCVGCGAPVGFIDRQYCCRCTAGQKEAAARSACPRCGQQRILQEDTGRCVTCSRVCIACGHPVRGKTATLCRDCARKAESDAAKAPCPRCDRPGYLREDTGWCGHCSRSRQSKQLPRTCRECGRARHHAGRGLCSACWQRHPDRPFIRAESLITELGEPPDWLRDFVAELAAKYCVSRVCAMITSLGRLLQDEQPTHPQALLERSRSSGRSMGSLARALESFFTGHGMAMATDQAERLAAGRRQRRIDAVPETCEKRLTRSPTS